MIDTMRPGIRAQILGEPQCSESSLTRERERPMIWYQQGDVLVKPATLPQGSKRWKGNVLAEGEATGHKHVVVGDGVTVFSHNNRLYFEAPNGAMIQHLEHNPISVPPGTYLVQIVRDYDHFAEEVRQVVD